MIEGIRLFKDTLKTAHQYIESIYISDSFLNRSNNIGSDENTILTLISHSLSDSISINSVKDSVFDNISGTVTSQGIMALVKKPGYSLESILSRTDQSGILSSSAKSENINQNKLRLLVLENIQDPGNLGTMLRTAEAAGMSGIVLSSDCADIYSPKVVRSSMGSIFRMPFVYCNDFILALYEIKKKGATIYAAYLHGGVSYKDIKFDPNHAILIGNEGNGLTEAAVYAADKRIYIPMEGDIESLNAAVAAAILMYK